MNTNTFLIIVIVVALLGSMIGASMVAIENSNKATSKAETTDNNTNLNRTSRKELFLPMVTILGLSVGLLIIGYGTGNIVASAVGFLLLFFGFGLLGSFLFRNIF